MLMDKFLPRPSDFQHFESLFSVTFSHITSPLATPPEQRECCKKGGEVEDEALWPNGRLVKVV